MIREKLRFFFGVVLISGAFGCGGERPAATEAAVSQAASTSQPPEPRQPAPAASAGTQATGYRGPLPPIPMSAHAGAPPDVVRAVYEFAARRPDVLRYVPCFCGCERNGHKANEDCFISARAADGRPDWDTHGLG